MLRAACACCWLVTRACVPPLRACVTPFVRASVLGGSSRVPACSPPPPLAPLRRTSVPGGSSAGAGGALAACGGWAAAGPCLARAVLGPPLPLRRVPAERCGRRPQGCVSVREVGVTCERGGAPSRRCVCEGLTGGRGGPVLLSCRDVLECRSQLPLTTASHNCRSPSPWAWGSPPPRARLRQGVATRRGDAPRGRRGGDGGREAGPSRDAVGLPRQPQGGPTPPGAAGRREA